MRRLLVAAGLIAALVGVGLSAQPASAATRCSTGAGATDYTRGGYEVVYRSYTSQRGMACSSVRYVMNRWIRRKVRAQYRWPHLTGPFWDGYVTWHCWKLTGYRIQCDEFTSNTSLRFTAYVR
jgi:hypothetical protein